MHLCRFLDDAASDHLYSLLQIFSYINFNILIHAPAKGATRRDCTHGVKHFDFNPRSREGSDRIRFRTSRAGRLFQSTLPRRERR